MKCVKNYSLSDIGDTQMYSIENSKNSAGDTLIQNRPQVYKHKLIRG